MANEDGQQIPKHLPIAPITAWRIAQDMIIALTIIPSSTRKSDDREAVLLIWQEALKDNLWWGTDWLLSIINKIADKYLLDLIFRGSETKHLPIARQACLLAKEVNDRRFEALCRLAKMVSLTNERAKTFGWIDAWRDLCQPAVGNFFCHPDIFPGVADAILDGDPPPSP